jgi:hypothetical protein
VFDPVFNVIVRLQFAVFDPLAVPPLAATPFTVTDEIPLLPSPESLAVPDTVIVAVVTVAPFAGLLIVRLGGVASPEPIVNLCGAEDTDDGGVSVFVAIACMV